MHYNIPIASVITFFPNNVIHISSIRTVRVLRPLRSINAVKGMRMLVATLLSSLPALGNVVLFFVFLLILFGILGVQLFAGIYENRCRITPRPFKNNSWPIVESLDRLCGGKFVCPSGTYCGNPMDYDLPFNATELDEGLNYGYTRFDDVIEAIFSIFQAMTLEGWSVQVYIVK